MCITLFCAISTNSSFERSARVSLQSCDVCVQAWNCRLSSTALPRGRNSIELGPFLVLSLVSRCCLRLAQVLHTTGVHRIAPLHMIELVRTWTCGLERPIRLDMLLQGDLQHNFCRQYSTPYLNKNVASGLSKRIMPVTSNIPDGMIFRFSSPTSYGLAGGRREGGFLKFLSPPFLLCKSGNQRPATPRTSRMAQSIWVLPRPHPTPKLK